jgi:hypothetical protein
MKLDTYDSISENYQIVYCLIEQDRSIIQAYEGGKP